MIEKRKVEVYLINQRCDVCKTGFMVYTGSAFMNASGQACEHKCNSCKNTTTYKQVYPHPEYEYV